MSKITIFALILVVLSLVGNEFILNTVDVIWTILGCAFVLFLFLFHLFDKKNQKNKQHNKN